MGLGFRPPHCKLLLVCREAEPDELPRLMQEPLCHNVLSRCLSSRPRVLAEFVQDEPDEKQKLPQLSI